MRYTSIDIIYNPKSTGPSQRMARDLKTELGETMPKDIPKVTITLRATKYAGHAEEIAYRCAVASKRPLIVSSSGDGGYNEVINGAMRAQAEGAQPTCAVLPAGNANDHSRTVRDTPLTEAILSGNETALDLLKAVWQKAGRTERRWAHSYIGLGLTPVVAVELNKTNLNVLKELWIVLTTFYKFRPFKVKHGGRILTLDSILFANIGQMAKVLTVAKNAKPNDGKFEVITFPHDRKLRLIHKLSVATTSGLKSTKRAKEYSFEALKKMPMQLDGEVRYVEKSSKVRITNEHSILKTII